MAAKKECFICYSNGKTEHEEMKELIYNMTTMDYPLVAVCDAFNCACSGHAHNRCLMNIEKCPMCRKETLPNLYVRCAYDIYFKCLLDWLKADRTNISKLNKYSFYCLLFGKLLLLICVMFEGQIKHHGILAKFQTMNLCWSVMIITLIFVPLYVFTTFNDYLVKYWLYDKNDGTCRVFYMT